MKKINANKKIKVMIAAFIFGLVLAFGSTTLYDIFSELIKKDGANEVIAGDGAVLIVVVVLWAVEDPLLNVLSKIFKIGGAENDFNNQKTRSSSNELTHEHNA